ncbi:MAG TPA: lipid-A-disaccharide synthase [Verrucomicrobiae bacterium]|nr:lipid-A-disaccharide synthase [Verrucomicrobiae bacterium]
MRPLFAVVAGEASGDILGAALIGALRARFPQATFYGVAGPRMRAAGCEAIESIEALSVMGLVEVLRHLPRLLKLRRDLVARFARDQPDAFIGIDAPDFNLRVERDLRARGIRTVHVNSPTIWAWRAGRVHGIAKAVDLMLCLYPFEPALYEKHGVRAAFIGHPLADQLDDTVPAATARRALGIDEGGPVVAILPGSRSGELRYLAEPFAAAAAWLHARIPQLRFVVPIARPDLRAVFEAATARHPGLRWHVLDGRSREAMQAADVVLLASGTAALECLLLGRPMVVAYRASALTEWLAWKLIKITHVSLPNILSNPGPAGEASGPVVPELLGHHAQPEQLGEEVAQLLRHPVLRQLQVERFDAVHRELRRDAGDLAAAAIAALLEGPAR